MASTRKDPIFGKKTFLFISGASRGLGQSLAVNITAKLGNDSFVVLLARNREGLEDTRQMILKSIPNAVKNVTVYLVTHDLARHCSHVGYDKMLQDVLRSADLQPEMFEQVILVHNAATLGNITKKVTELVDAEEFEKYWAMNITSPAILNNVLLKYFSPKKGSRNVLCINITSICALQPFKTWSLYCTGKSARNMWFNVLAVEEPDLRVLNYAPGPLDTDMQLSARTSTADDDMREIFEEMHQKGELLSTDVSARKLIYILETNTFESGAHIDYFDVSESSEVKENGADR